MGLMRRCLLVLIVLLGLAACQSVPEKKEGLTPEQIAAIKAEGFVESDEGWELTAPEKLLFGSNEFKLESSARQSVERIGQLLIKLDILRLRVDGHADASGAASYNEQLSLRRAQAVADVLIETGIAADGVKVRGLGSRVPLASNQSVEGRAQNRRVVLVIQSH